MASVGRRTFVIFIIDELFRSNHVQQLKDTTFLQVIGCCTGKHGHGVHAHLEAGSLRHADAGAFDFEVFVAEFHAVESFDGDVGRGRVDVFTESDTLWNC